MGRNIKEGIGVILFSIINIIVAYSITTSLGIKEIILFQSYTATNNIITYEIIVWFILCLIEAVIYEKAIKKGRDY